MAGSRHDWWMIGSAAVALYLDRPIDVADIDILAHPDDAAAVLSGASFVAGPDPNERFRSAVFGRIGLRQPAIEVMAGLGVRTSGGWQAVRPRTRQWQAAGRTMVPVPAAWELRAILLLFDRPKDRARAALLDASLDPGAWQAGQ